MDVNQIVKNVLSGIYPEGENPMGNATVTQIAEASGLKRRRDMTPEERKGHDEALRRRRRRKEAKRKEREEERAEKRTNLDPPKEVLRAAMDVTTLLVPHIEEMSYARSRRMERMMGSCAQDVCHDTFVAVNREIALALLSGDYAAEGLTTAAVWLADKPAGVNLRDYKDVPDAAYWIMGVIGNRVKSTIETWYRAQKDTDSLDRLDTALANTGGVDMLIENFKADAKPFMVGASFPKPGKVDRDLLHMTMDGAITERGLDALYELALMEENMDAYGRFRWSQVAEQVFIALGMESGWQALQAKTDSPELQGRYARGLARRATAWVPETLDKAITHYEGMAHDTDERDEHGARLQRPQMQYVLTFPDIESAARALVTVLEEVTTS